MKLISSFDVSNGGELKDAFNRVNTQPLLKEVHSQKDIRLFFLDYRLQFGKSYLVLNLIDESFKNFVLDEIYSETPNKNYGTIKISHKHIDEKRSFDLADFSDYLTSNKRGYRFLIITFDKFSMYSRCTQLKIKDKQTLTQHFSKIPNTSIGPPVKIESDSGKEIFYSNFENFQ